MASPTSPPGGAPRARVLLVTHHYSPENGAPVRRWDSLVEHLTPAGFEFGVLAPPPHYPGGTLTDAAAEYRPGSVGLGRHGERVVRTRFREHSRGLVSRTLDQVVAAASAVPLGLRHFGRRGARPDVVIGTVPGIPSMFAAWVLARLLGARFVVEMRDAWPDLIQPSGMLSDGPGRGLRQVPRVLVTRLAHVAISRLQARADLVVTTTETFADVLRSRGQRRVAVVRNGTSMPAPAQVVPVDAGDARPVDARPGVDRPLRAVYLGTIGRAQSLDSVVLAAAALKERGCLLEVRIVGRGSDVDALRRLVARTDAPVTIEDAVSHAEALALYRWADTAIVALHRWGPFEWTIPSKVYEVMARGTTVTAALAGEAADLVRAVGAGVVVPPDDPAALADQWASWCEAGAVPPASQEAARWVMAFATWDVLAVRYAGVLDSLVER